VLGVRAANGSGLRRPRRRRRVGERRQCSRWASPTDKGRARWAAAVRTGPWRPSLASRTTTRHRASRATGDRPAWRRARSRARACTIDPAGSRSAASPGA